MIKQNFARLFTTLLLFFLLLYNYNYLNAQAYSTGKYNFSIKDTDKFSIAFQQNIKEAGITEAMFSFRNMDSSLKKLSISWSIPLVDIVGCWTSNSDEPKFLRMNSSIKANLASHAPVISVFGSNNANRLTFALSDAFHPTTLTAGVNEDKGIIVCTANISLDDIDKNKMYNITVLLNDKPYAYYDAIKSVSSWWSSMPEYKPAFIPGIAKEAMYSTWYSYHQSLDKATLTEECTLSKKIGYKTIIIDDGWQSTVNMPGYGHTGDWNPERIKDMAGLVKEIHQTGMKCMLWYSVPFVGYSSKAYNQFKDKFLYKIDRISAGVLDPRYPEVRNFLIQKYLNAAQQWDLDGFKLDFIDSFTNLEEIPKAGNGADIISLYEAIDKLMADIKKALTTIKPDILIEFRQSYTGPAMRKYGNMFRAGDCPESAIANRTRITDIKLLAGSSAVHSDMLTWQKDEPAHIAALQFLNVIFAVPQLSVRINELSTAHLSMIKFYSKYWTEHRDVLLNGDFKAYYPELHYPILSSTQNDTSIIGLYADMLINMDNNVVRIDIINAKSTKNVLIDAPTEKQYMIEIYTCEGQMIERKSITLKKGTNKINVPPSGLLKMSVVK